MGPNSSGDLSLRKCPLRTAMPLSVLITSILVEFNVVDYLVFDRGLQYLARFLLEQLFEKGFLLSSAHLPSEITLLSGTGASFLLASSGEVVQFLFEY